MPKQVGYSIDQILIDHIGFIYDGSLDNPQGNGDWRRRLNGAIYHEAVEMPGMGSSTIDVSKKGKGTSKNGPNAP